MVRLEELTVGTRTPGIVPGALVTTKSVARASNQAVETTFVDEARRLDQKLVFRDDEHATPMKD